MIQLHSLTISRFRGVREGHLEGLTDVNLLIGRNNCGKSTVFEAVMRSFAARGQGHDILGRDVKVIWSEVRQEVNKVLPEFWYRQEQSQAAELSVSFRDSKLPTRRPGPLTGVRFLLDSTGRKAVRVGDDHRVFAEPPLQPFVAGATLVRPIDSTNRKIEQEFWPRLLGNRRDKVLTKILNDVFDLGAESFQLLPDSRLMVLFDTYSIPLDSQGDGTRTAMRSLMILAMLQGTLLLLEEPECHQHPGSLEKYAKAICHLAREQDVQVLISTHSAECVRAFLGGAAKASSDAAVFHLTLDDGKQQARRLDPEAVQTLQSTGVDVRFLDLYG